MKTDETNIPTNQTPPQTKIRLSRTNENNFGTQGNQSPPQSRPQSSCRLTFSKRDRLLRRYEFKRLSREGRRLVGQKLCIDYARASKLRLGITASTHYGSSPERNRFKRLVREVFRLHRDLLPKNLDLNISPRKLAKKASFAEIQNEIFYLLAIQPQKDRPGCL
jgi:ribonuclease P protein component